MNDYTTTFKTKLLHTLHTSLRQEPIHTCFYYIHRSYTKTVNFNVVVYEPTFSKIYDAYVEKDVSSVYEGGRLMYEPTSKNVCNV